MSLKHLNIRVTGRVQGVSFRYYTQLKAQDLGLTGFVRNQADGSVYVEAEGEESLLKSLVDWCYEGSPMAKVQQVEVVELPILQHFSDFQVHY